MIRCQAYSENYIEVFLKELLFCVCVCVCVCVLGYVCKGKRNIFSFT